MSTNTGTTRDGSIDLAKAIAISLVLVWHLTPFSVGSVDSPAQRALQVVLVFLYEQVCLVGVPVFFLTSLLLLNIKLETEGRKYLVRRFRRLLLVFLAWSAVQTLCFCGMHLAHDLFSGEGVTWHSFGMSPVALITMGGPALPYVGDSVFYFIFVLILLTLLSLAFQALKWRGTQRMDALAWGSFVLCLLYLQWLNWTGRGLAYSRVDNFIVYVPLAFVCRAHTPEKSRRIGFLMLACYFASVVQDYFLKRHGLFTGFYSRPSVVFGAAATLALLRGFPVAQLPASVAFLSRYSLGIFALHKYWLLATIAIMLKFPLPPSALVLDVSALIKALLCLALTCVSVHVLGRTRLSWLVR